MKDISEQIEIDDMPVCPLCDNSIYQYEEIALVSAHTMIALVHKWCLDDEGI